MVLMFEKHTKWTLGVRKQEQQTHFSFLSPSPHLAHPSDSAQLKCAGYLEAHIEGR